jgi:hypothetical protein
MASVRQPKGACLHVEHPFSTLEYWSMTYGNDMRDDSQQLRDIQDLIAKLADVNRKLALPIRTVTMDQPTDTQPAETPTA